jgi:putative oxidoreductase
MVKTSHYAQWSPRVLSVLRIVVGLLFLEHGTQKILGFPPSPNLGPALFSLSGLQGLIEFLGGLLILVGLFTRPVAFVLCGNMAVAYFMSHAPKNFFPMMNGGDAAILYCFVFLYLVFAGAGAWSIDEALGAEGTARASGSVDGL